jgi:hypothetical protein
LAENSGVKRSFATPLIPLVPNSLPITIITELVIKIIEFDHFKLWMMARNEDGLYLPIQLVLD